MPRLGTGAFVVLEGLRGEGLRGENALAQRTLELVERLKVFLTPTRFQGVDVDFAAMPAYAGTRLGAAHLRHTRARYEGEW
jgi:hypothetical protein